MHVRRRQPICTKGCRNGNELHSLGLALLTSKKTESAEELGVDSQSPGFVSLKHSFALLLKFYSRFTFTILFPLLILLFPSFFFLA